MFSLYHISPISRKDQLNKGKHYAALSHKIKGGLVTLDKGKQTVLLSL